MDFIASLVLLFKYPRDSQLPPPFSFLLCLHICYVRPICAYNVGSWNLLIECVIIVSHLPLLDLSQQWHPTDISRKRIRSKKVPHCWVILTSLPSFTTFNASFSLVTFNLDCYYSAACVFIFMICELINLCSQCRHFGSNICIYCFWTSLFIGPFLTMLSRRYFGTE